MQNPTTPNLTSGAQLHGGQTRTHLFILPRKIVTDLAFQFRQRGTETAHVKGLAQTLRTVGNLDPILVWQEIDACGQQTGRLVLLDGHHRLAAYATVKSRSHAVPAVVLKGDRTSAMLAAVQANSRESLPLTKNERMDAAWRLVRLPSKRLTVPAVAEAAGVAPRSVDNMRKRWKAMEASGKEMTGNWWRDRLDELPEMKDRLEMTDLERNAAIEQLAGVIRGALGKMPWHDQNLAAEALQRAIGSMKLRSMAEFLYGDYDEFDEAQTDALAGNLLEAEEDTVGQDF